MDGTAVESAFALLLTKVTKPPYPAKISYNRHNGRKYKLCAISGTLFRRRGEEHNDEKKKVFPNLLGLVNKDTNGF